MTTNYPEYPTNEQTARTAEFLEHLNLHERETNSQLRQLHKRVVDLEKRLNDLENKHHTTDPAENCLVAAVATVTAAVSTTHLLYTYSFCESTPMIAFASTFVCISSLYVFVRCANRYITDCLDASSKDSSSK